MFMDPKIEDTPITCTENMKKFTVEGAYVVESGA